MTAELDLHHLAAAYALDALDAGERMAFEAHYTDCVVCSQDVNDFRSTLAGLGELTAVAAPASLRAEVLDRIATTRQLSPQVTKLADRRHRRPSLLAAAAAVVLFIAAASFLVGRGSHTDDAFADELAQVLAQPDVRLVDLPATSDAARGHFRVAWSALSGQTAIIGNDLLPADDGLVYELWLIDAAGPVPAHLLDRAGSGEVRRVLELAGQPLKWGVTIEPAGGSPSPTGEILFLGDA